MALIHLLIAAPREQAARYHAGLGAGGQYMLTLTSDSHEALDLLEDPSHWFDMLILDGAQAGAADLLEALRARQPRRLLVLVDDTESSPLRAQVRPDLVCATPFVDDALDRQIARLLSDRQLDTMPVNTLPLVRELARKLRAEEGAADHFLVAVDACQELGYSYSAFYSLERVQPVLLRLAVQRGEANFHLLIPLSAENDDAIAQVATTGVSRVLGADNAADYLPASVGALGSVALLAVGKANCFGVLVAGCEDAAHIDALKLGLLEMVAAQLAAAIAREMGL